MMTMKAEENVIQYELEHVNMPSSFVVNTGAIKLIEKLTRTLTPYGFAILTDYGSTHTTRFFTYLATGNTRKIFAI